MRLLEDTVDECSCGQSAKKVIRLTFFDEIEALALKSCAFKIGGRLTTSFLLMVVSEAVTMKSAGILLYSVRSTPAFGSAQLTST